MQKIEIIETDNKKESEILIYSIKSDSQKSAGNYFVF